MLSAESLLMNCSLAHFLLVSVLCVLVAEVLKSRLLQISRKLIVFSLK